jgi:hypothetical protein
MSINDSFRVGHGNSWQSHSLSVSILYVTRRLDKSASRRGRKESFCDLLFVTVRADTELAINPFMQNCGISFPVEF